LHRAQDGKVDCLLERLSSDLVQDALDLETVLQAVTRNAEFTDEFAEDLKFSGVGGFMNSAKKQQLFVPKSFGDRLVRGEHEFFNDLMAFCVLETPCSDDFSLSVEQNLEFG
jgi:hypothetical protein